MDIKKAIRALLQSDFGGVQLSAARVDELAKRLDGKVENEDQVKEKLSVFNDLLPFSDIAKEDDRQRSLNSELEKLKKGAGKSEEKVEGGAGEGGSSGAGTEDVPAWAKAIIEGNKAVTEKLAALEGQKVVNDRKSLIQAKLKDADEAYSAKVVRDFGRMSFADDAAFEEYLADVEADYASHVQATAESKLGNDAPFAGLDKGGRVKEASQAEIDALFGDIKI